MVKGDFKMELYSSPGGQPAVWSRSENLKVFLQEEKTDRMRNVAEHSENKVIQLWDTFQLKW